MQDGTAPGRACGNAGNLMTSVRITLEQPALYPSMALV